jgi:hypothetical protein
MSSERKSRTARENGAKSRGPRTPEGKHISSHNGVRHGLLAKRLLLDRESAARFYELVNEVRGEFAPQTPAETAAVETMAWCRWRQLRLWTLENAAINYEIMKQPVPAPGEPHPDGPTCAVLAFRTLADHSRTLTLLNRYETSTDRQLTRAMNRFYALRSAREAAREKVKLRSEPTNPLATQELV